MMGKRVWDKTSLQGTSAFSMLFSVLIILASMLLAGLFEAFAPSLLSNVLPAKATFQEVASLFSALVIGVLLVLLIFILRLDEFAAAIVVAAHLYLDFYLGLVATAQFLALALLVVFFLARAPQRPWTEPRYLWLWALFLGLTILPSIHGALTLDDALMYYPNIILGSFIFFWLGTAVSRNPTAIRRLFQFLAGFAALLALHTIILATTGKFLLGSSRFDTFLATVGNFQSSDIGVQRLGAFFVDPNWNGTFFAIMIFLPFSLFFQASSLRAKALYLAETLVMLPALLFTYSAGAWLATIGGLLVFTFFAGHIRYRIQISLCIVLAIGSFVLLFPAQLGLLLQHASGTGELQLRLGAWETALRVIGAFPFSGVGLGLTNYMQQAEPYRVPAQYVPLVHPHDSYLELGAMAGLPVLFIFLALIATSLRQAIRTWSRADPRNRSIIAGGIACIAALCINSISINAWTLPPLAGFGWLILGVISSPLLLKSQMSAKEQKANDVRIASA